MTFAPRISTDAAMEPQVSAPEPQPQVQQQQQQQQQAVYQQQQQQQPQYRPQPGQAGGGFAPSGYGAAGGQATRTPEAYGGGGGGGGYAMFSAASPGAVSQGVVAQGGIMYGAAPADKATQLLAACESCLSVTRIPGFDMSFRRIMENKCPRCNGNLVLPQEIMEMLILYGHFVAEPVAVTVLLGTMALHPSLRPDFVASAMNELLIPMQSDFVYDVAVPKRPEGLGMSLRMHQGDLAVGGFVDFDNNTESPTVAARIIAVGDVLVAINKKAITSWSFEKSIRMLASAASPVYLTFRRVRPVTIL